MVTFFRMMGIPILSHQALANFRAALNTQLGQHPHVAIAQVPRWVPAPHAPGAVAALTVSAVGLSKLGVSAPSARNLGAFLLVVRKDGEAALLSSQGAWMYVGRTSCGSLGRSCVLVVALSRAETESALGGTLTVLDTLAADGKNLLEMTLEERASFTLVAHEQLLPPARYRMASAKPCAAFGHREFLGRGAFVLLA